MFSRANYFLKTNKVKILNETDHSIRLQVNKDEVVLKYKNHELIYLCTCRSGAFNKLCSHVLAAISYLNGKTTD